MRKPVSTSPHTLSAWPHITRGHHAGQRQVLHPLMATIKKTPTWSTYGQELSARYMTLYLTLKRRERQASWLTRLS